jgi:fluoride exporter
MKNALIVFVGSGLGGVTRHLLNSFITGLAGPGFPWGILIINITGSLALGLLAELFALRTQAPPELRLFLTTGIIAGYTTFSTFSLDTALLYERGQAGLAVVYVAASVVVSIAALFVGLWIVRWASP